MIRDKRNIMKLGVVITTSITMLFTIGCSPKNIEESSILSEDVRKDSENSSLKVVSKEEYKITDKRIKDTLLNNQTGSKYLKEYGDIYIEYNDPEVDIKEPYVRKLSSKLLFKDGEVTLDPSKNSIIEMELESLTGERGIYQEIVDGYLVTYKSIENIDNNSDSLKEKVTIKKLDDKFSNKKISSSGYKLEDDKEISINIPKEIHYYGTIGIIDNKLLYVGGDERGQQFPNKIGIIDLEKEEIQEIIETDKAYENVEIIDENTVIIKYIGEGGNDLSILNLKNKSNEYLVTNKNIGDFNISNNKEKLYYFEENDEKTTIYAMIFKGEDKGSKCKVYEGLFNKPNENEIFSPPSMVFSSDSKELYLGLFRDEPKIIKYKLNK